MLISLHKKIPATFHGGILNITSKNISFSFFKIKKSKVVSDPFPFSPALAVHIVPNKKKTST